MLKLNVKHITLLSLILFWGQPTHAFFSELFTGLVTGAGTVAGVSYIAYARLKGQISSLEQKIDEQHCQLQDNTQAVDELRSHNEKNFSDVKTGVSATKKGLAVNTKQLRAVQIDVRTGITGLDHRMQKRFDGLDGKLTWLIDFQQSWLEDAQKNRLSGRSTVVGVPAATTEPQKRLLSHLVKTASRRLLK